MVIYYDSANDTEDHIEDDAMENALAEEVEVRSFLDLADAVFPDALPENLSVVYRLTRGGRALCFPKAFADLFDKAKGIRQVVTCLPQKNAKVRFAVDGIDRYVDEIQRGLVGIVLALGIGRATSKKL